MMIIGEKSGKISPFFHLKRGQATCPPSKSIDFISQSISLTVQQTLCRVLPHLLPSHERLSWIASRFAAFALLARSVFPAVAPFSASTHLQVLLGGGGYNLAEKLCEFRRMLRFLISGLLPVKSDLRITFSVGNSCHRQIHSDFLALAS